MISAPACKYLWHVRLHQRIANEQLVFLLAGYDPVYDQKKTTEALKRIFVELGIRSYSLWELLGDHDLMIQAWLPAGIDVAAFSEAVFDSVPRVSADTLSVSVDRFEFHWMWPARTSVAIDGNGVDPEHFVTLNGPEARSVPKAKITEYLNSNHLARLPSYGSYKFFLRLTNPVKAYSEDIKSQLAQIISNAVAEEGISQAALMRVNGDGGSWLLTGRIRKSDLEAIGRVSDRLSASGLLSSLRCRTVTHLAARPYPVDRREQLLPDIASNATQPPSAEQVQSWALTPENDELEFKSSAFSDIDFRVGRKSESRTKDEQVAVIAKAVCGFLNAEGGNLVIGVAEADKYTPNELLSAFPDVKAIGERLVIGVQHEYTASGWDRYQRALASKLRSLIEGELDGWVKFHEVEVENGNRVAVIRIRRPSDYYYVKLKASSQRVFYGRSGGETLVYDGQAMDDFKRAHPRSSRG